MKKYLLTVIGNFENKEICKEVALTLTPIVDSPHLKFQSSQGVLLFHFESEVEQTEMHDYIQGSLFDIVNTFILTELTDNVSVCMPKDVKEHLFDLENDNNEVSINIDLNQNRRNFDEMEEDDDFVALLLNEVRSKVKAPSLDQLLDKIASNGVESLTQFEKDTLDSYSKN
jgi:hypothetical protein